MTAASAGRDPDRPFKLPRPRQIEELSPDQLVAVIWRLAMEICVLRDRLGTHEQLLAEKAFCRPKRSSPTRPPGTKPPPASRPATS